jgi:hypothetical protein
MAPLDRIRIRIRAGKRMAVPFPVIARSSQDGKRGPGYDRKRGIAV